MKHISPLLITLFALCLANAWADTKTVTLTHTDFALTNSYATKTATIDGYSFTIDKGFLGSQNSTNCIQMNNNKKGGNGILYNTTSIPGLKSITVNVASGSNSYTITTGTSEKPTIQAGSSAATSTINVKNTGDTYFQLKVSGASYFSSIVITYETSTSSCTQLATPTNLVVKNITSSTVDISWDAVPNATKYKVTCIGDDATIEKEVSATSDQLTGLNASSQYLWSVKAIGDGTTYCDSEESETKDFTTLAPSAPCTPLPAPTGLNASALTYSTATLTWAAVDNATKYQITTTPPRVRK